MEEIVYIFFVNDWCWIVDFIDGIINFVRGIFIWGIFFGLFYWGILVFGFFYFFLL